MTATIQPKQTDWRKNKAATDHDPDDELLPATPLDVIKVLGFDPLEVSEQELAEA